MEETKKVLKFNVEIEMPEKCNCWLLDDDGGEPVGEKAMDESKIKFTKGIEECLNKFMNEKLPQYFKDNFDDGELLDGFYVEDYELDDYKIKLTVERSKE